MRTCLKETLKSWPSYRSRILKWMCKWRKHWLFQVQGVKAVEPLLNRIDSHVCKHKLFALLSVTVPGWRAYTKNSPPPCTCEWALIWKEDLFNVIKLRWGPPGWGWAPNPIWLLSSEKEEVWTQMLRKNFMWSGDCSDASMNQGSPSVAGGWSEKLGESGRGLPRLQSECGPADTLIADF